MNVTEISKAENAALMPQIRELKSLTREDAKAEAVKIVRRHNVLLLALRRAESDEERQTLQELMDELYNPAQLQGLLAISRGEAVETRDISARS